MEQKNQGKQKKSRSGDSPFKNHHCALTLVFPGVDKTWGCPSISHLSTAPCTTELLKSKQMRQQRSPLQTSCLSSWSPTERDATGSEGSTGWGLIVFLQLRQGPREGQRTAAPLSGTLSFWGVPLYGCTCMLGSGPCRPSFPIWRSHEHRTVQSLCTLWKARVEKLSLSMSRQPQGSRWLTAT